MASEWLVSTKISELLSSDKFDKDSMTDRQLNLSQAFCLLWQNEETGDVAGRQRPNAMTDTATAALLLDLYVMEKIDLEKEIKHWMDRKRQIVMVKVKDASLTGSYLDRALFSDIVKHHQRTDGKSKTIVEWIIQGSYERDNSATVVLDSLVMLGILRRESKLFGRRYPMVNSDPQRKLVDEIRNVVLLNQPADSFIWTLLKLMYEADCCMGKKFPVLSRYFTPEEFLAAKDMIKTLVTVNIQDECDTSAQSFELKIVG